MENILYKIIDSAYKTGKQFSMKILFVYFSHSSQLTGGSNTLYQLIQGLDKDKFYPILLSQKHDALTKKLEECGIETKIIEFPHILDVYNKSILQYSLVKKIQSLIAIIKYNIQIASLVRKEKIDLIWTNNLRALLTASITAKLLGIPIIWNVWLGEKSEGYFKLLNSIGLALSNRVVTEYKNQKHDLFSGGQIRKYNDKFRTVYTSLPDKFKDFDSYDSRKKFGLSNKEFVIGTVASIIPRKGHIYILEAVREIKKHSKNIKYLIAGDIPSNHYKDHYERLKKSVKENELEENVHFLGFRDDIPEVLSCLDLLVLTSSNEGVPVAIKEAMAMAKPVVATSVGGISEAIVNGETGILIPPADVNALTSAIKFIMENPEKAREMGLNAKKRVEELFSSESYIKNYEAVLSEFIQSGSV